MYKESKLTKWQLFSLKWWLFHPWPLWVNFLEFNISTLYSVRYKLCDPGANWSRLGPNVDHLWVYLSCPDPFTVIYDLTELLTFRSGIFIAWWTKPLIIFPFRNAVAVVSSVSLVMKIPKYVFGQKRHAYFPNN